LKQSGANVAIATTGLAGPSSGDGEDPVGTICLAWVFKKDDRMRVETEKTRFDGERNAIRAAASFYALRKLVELHKSMN
jgi:nicotinamide mononucleotide (NMN) deamidase PncC